MFRIIGNNSSVKFNVRLSCGGGVIFIIGLLIRLGELPFNILIVASSNIF